MSKRPIRTFLRQKKEFFVLIDLCMSIHAFGGATGRLCCNSMRARHEGLIGLCSLRNFVVPGLCTLKQLAKGIVGFWRCSEICEREKNAVASKLELILCLPA